MPLILSIDQGTTSSRAILFNENFVPQAIAQEEFRQYYPNSGWVEHNPQDLWKTTLSVCKKVVNDTNLDQVVSIGITNQRETTLVWDRTTGETLYNAIVWQDRRTSSYCADLKDKGFEQIVTEKTGLLLDPYFSATKINWILNHVPDGMRLAHRGELLFGTVDTYLIWRLTNGRDHVTDITNASRTMLFNIAEEDWDDELLNLFEIPRSMLPRVDECVSDFGMVKREYFGKAIPIRGVAGDQQAATIGQACFKPGMLKSTYGTGCFALLNTGKQLVHSHNRLLSTIAYKINGQTNYALEGSIFIAGAVVQWLRDGLGIVNQSSETQQLAENADHLQEVILVPAFTGLGAPYWDSDCRGSIFGITRNTSPNEIAKAALESVAFQTSDLLKAMQMDYPDLKGSILRADGGMTSSDYTMQSVANILGVTVEVPKIAETTSLGVAYLAGLGSGLCNSLEEIETKWEINKRFTTGIDDSTRAKKLANWKDAVNRTLSHPT